MCFNVRARQLIKEPLRIVKLPAKFRGIFSNVYECRDATGREFLFKHVKSGEVILNELLADSIARILDVPVLEFLERRTVEGRDGLVMAYLKRAVLLSNYDRKLNENQLRELQRIVLFDLLIGNRDRHSANVLVDGNLVAFDHARVFVDRYFSGTKFVKLDLGRFLDDNYADKIEKISAAGSVSTGKALINRLGFHEEDVKAVKEIRDSELRRAVDGVKCPEEIRDAAYGYVAFRKRVFDALSYC